jgi:uncharacterized protein
LVVRVRTLTHDRRGRIRLVWRLLLFLLVVEAVVAVVGWALPGRGLWGASTALLAGALGAGFLLLRLEGRAPGALGFHLAPSVPGEVGKGGALGLGLAVLVVAGITLAGGVRWAREAGSLGGWLEGAVRAGAFLALAAAAEEALLRGYPLQALAEGMGAGWALVATSAAFGALHLGNPGATPLGAANTAAAGLFLGAVVLRTGSLWWAAGAHLGWNWGVGWLADLPVSGIEVADAPGVAAIPVGPDWLGGGAFGPEGSVVATLGFLAAAAACWWGPWLSLESAAAARRLPAAGLGSERNAAASPGRHEPEEERGT